MFKDVHDVTPSPQKIAKKDDAQKKITSLSYVTVQVLMASVSPVKPSITTTGQALGQANTHTHSHTHWLPQVTNRAAHAHVGMTPDPSSSSEGCGPPD